MAITSKEINLKQLDEELGSQGLCGDFNDANKKIITLADNSTVTEAELVEAIKSHIAKPSEAKVIELNREQGLIKLKELGFTEAEIEALLL